MILEKLYCDYQQFGWDDYVEVPCGEEGCDKIEKLKKGSAINNIKRNGKFRCRSCSFTEEGKKKISQATTYKRSSETKVLMSKSKKEFYQTPRGKIARRKLARKAVNEHASGKFHGCHLSGYYPSQKTGNIIYFGSSYELRCHYLLDQDKDVRSFDSQIAVEVNGRSRCLDVVIEYMDGHKEIKEVKPKSRLNEEAIQLQIYDNSCYAEEMKCDFNIWTEDDSGLENEQAITRWAEDFILSELKGVDFAAIRKAKANEKSKQYYKKHIKDDTVTLFCEFCQKEHVVLRKTYDKAIERNGRYICEKEGGHIGGSSPKPTLRKVNPYAAEGKKQCNKCKEIKLFEDFSPDKSKRDGFSTRCKTCRAEIYRTKYQNKINDIRRTNP